MFSKKYSTADALFQADLAGEISSDDFDDALYFGLIDHLEDSSTFPNHPLPAVNYIASRMLEWEVGNGGFSQAAYNIPDWFSPAAQGYNAIGLPKAAALIQKAQKLIHKGEAKGFLARNIGDLFAQFNESKLAKLNEEAELERVGWWAIEKRLQYVRENKAAFYSYDQ
jgi:hypothetical protein